MANSIKNRTVNEKKQVKFIQKQLQTSFNSN